MKLHFNQTWLDKVTSEDDVELIASGKPSSYEGPYPFDEQFKRFYKTAPAKEMMRRGWLRQFDQDSHLDTDLLQLKQFFLNKSHLTTVPSYFRGSAPISHYDLVHHMALLGWMSRLGSVTETFMSKNISRFYVNSLESERIKELVALSKLAKGPAKAQDWLRDRGIRLIYLPGLPSMKIDGVSFMLDGKHPCIAMTLRYDRLDYFWFTLLHEIGHIKKHLINNITQMFIDDIDEDKSTDEVEAEANSFARDSLIPRDLWRRSDAYRFKSKHAVIEFSKQIGVHPAIVAGRIRFETGNYALLTELTGEGEVREMYSNREGTIT